MDNVINFRRNKIKWSCFSGQPSGVSAMYPLVDHTAIFSFSPAKNLVWGSYFKGCVWAFGVVKSNPFLDDPFGVKAVRDFVQIDGLLFEGPPEALDSKACIQRV